MYYAGSDSEIGVLSMVQVCRKTGREHKRTLKLIDCVRLETFWKGLASTLAPSSRTHDVPLFSGTVRFCLPIASLLGTGLRPLRFPWDFLRSQDKDRSAVVRVDFI